MNPAEIAQELTEKVERTMSESKARSGSLHRDPFQKPGSARRAIRGGLFKALKRTFRRWGLLSFLALICLGLGILAAQMLGKSYWTSQVTLIYPENLKVDLKNIAYDMRSIARGNPPPQDIAEYVNHPELYRNFSITNPAGTTQLILKQNGKNPELADQILDSLLLKIINEFKQMDEAQSKADKAVLVPQIKTLEDQISKLKAEKVDYLSKNGILDPGEERTKSKNRISFLETQLDQLKIASTGYKSELEIIKKRHQQSQIDISQRKMEEERDDLVQDVITDSRHRQDRINQLLKEEETRIELEATLAAKEKEKSLVDDLVKQNKAGRIDQVKLENEILILKARLNGNKKTQTYSNEMMKLDKIIVPDSKKSPKSFFAEKVMFSFYEKQNDAELKILASLDKIDQLQRELDAERTRLKLLDAAIGKSAEWDLKIQPMEAQKKELVTKSGELDPLKSGKSMTPFRFAPKEPGEKPHFQSTKPALFFSVFFGGFGVSFLLVLMTELISGVRSTGDIAKSLKIPVHRISSSAASLGNYRDLCRNVRNQEILGKTVLQVQSIADGPTGVQSVGQVSEKLAEAFTSRGEKVVLVDLFQKEGDGEGLSEFLATNRETLDGLVQSTSNPQVFRVTAGKESIDGTALAGPRMKVFLETLQKQFGAVLIQGQGLTRIHEVEALGVNTQGTIVVTRGNGAMNPEGKEALLDLAAEGLLPRAMVIV